MGMEEINDKINYAFVGGQSGFQIFPLEKIATSLGVSVVALRFTLGILAGYPLSLLYLLFPRSASHKHLYFTLSGILINYFCFGSDCVYNLFSVFLSYVSLAMLGPSIKNVLFNFIFHTVYLFIGYIINASDGYDVKWTTPQCVLCLRLIGLAWDMYDGQLKEETLSAEQMKYRITGKVSFMELFGFSYCFCGFLSGPQFSFQRYIKFVNNTLVDKDVQEKQNNRYLHSLKRFLCAALVTGLFAVFDSSYRCDHLLQPNVLNKPFFSKVLLMGTIYYVQFAKYVFVWWYAESICMMLGISYDGKNKDGSPKWEGVNNFKFRKFFFGAFFQDIIESFNIQTNKWSGRYVFKRLRFLGNKMASHVLTLVYLSLWHGFYVGYLIMFFCEFVAVTMEKQLRELCFKVSDVSWDELSLKWKIPLQMFGAIYKFLACGFFVQSFMLLRWRRIKVVYASVYYWPIVVMATWFVVLHPLLRTMLPRRKSGQKEDSKKEK